MSASPSNSLPMPKTPQAVLEQVFGYENFKPPQQEVIQNVLARRDTLVIMPTGGGKSLCYQIPALIFPGLTVVVSPLIALMKDQVEQLRAAGVPALFLNSSLSAEEYRVNVALVRAGKVKLLYVAPETLLTERILELLNSVPFDCLTIDEAHCISEWGHDFRPEYRQIAAVRKRFRKVVCVALTATATPRVREDIAASLEFDQANAFIASFNRDNLLIEVVPKTDVLQQTLQFLARYPDQSGIIYCFTRKTVDELAAALVKRKISARAYHAGLEDIERRANQEAFIRDEVQVMVATIAFGMGIHKPNVRFVIHVDLPKSIDSYYQEIGRAGRDGLPAHCILLYSFGDAQKLRYFIDKKEGVERQVAYQHLSALTRYAECETCRRTPLLKYFGEEFGVENCGMCDNCLSGGRQEVDMTIPAQKFLSCVLRTNEVFGAVHIVDVLLGDATEKVRKHQHDSLTTFGIGKELTRTQWLHFSRQLLQKGLVELDEKYGSLKLTPQGSETLRKREPVMGVLRQEAEKVAPAGRADTPEYDHALFDLLRKKRKTMADEEHVAPYIIFSDRTLVEMAGYFPQSEASMLHINGVGTVKMQRYGSIFLEMIQEYCTRNHIAEKKKERERAAREPRVAVESLHTPRYIEVAEAYNAGKTITGLTAEYGVKVDTILEHLTRYALEDHPLRVGADLPEVRNMSADQVSQALRLFQTEGAQFLKPVFDRMSGQVSYEDLRILRLQYLQQKGRDTVSSQ
jgi:ATP-dependent DNA helicase RecQ